MISTMEYKEMDMFNVQSLNYLASLQETKIPTR